jgi:hypothetical protein
MNEQLKKLRAKARKIETAKYLETWKKRAENSNRYVMSFKTSLNTKEKIVRYCDKHKISQSEFFRKIIENALLSNHTHGNMGGTKQ